MNTKTNEKTSVFLCDPFCRNTDVSSPEEKAGELYKNRLSSFRSEREVKALV